MKRIILYAGTIWILTACGGTAPQVEIQSTPTNTQVITQSPTATWTPVPSATRTETASPTPKAVEICSPLAGVALSSLSDRVSNPYAPPASGSDDPHQGVDLVDELPGTDMAVAGLEVDAVLAGEVALVIKDRFPYGNAVFIETRLDDLPEDWPGLALLPEAASSLTSQTVLTCPSLAGEPSWDATKRSIYLVYAHMQSTPLVEAGDQVSCGEPLGSIGDTGNALNPHLHLEVRVGPANTRFSSMAHYDNSASQEEMANYCLWRVSGWFQLADPLEVLGIEK